MGRDVVSAKLDVIFKKLFTENEDLLHSFVASMLDIPTESIKTIKISNPELPPETVESKFSRLDLSLNVDDKLINVEIQVKMEPDYRDRTLFYWAKLYTSELKSEEERGIAKGRTEGIAKAKAEIIEKIEASGMTDEQISCILS